MSNELYDRLEQFVVEAESSREKAYEESIRRRKAEKEVIDVIRQVKSQHFFLIFLPINLGLGWEDIYILIMVHIFFSQVSLFCFMNPDENASEVYPCFCLNSLSDFRSC